MRSSTFNTLCGSSANEAPNCQRQYRQPHRLSIPSAGRQPMKPFAFAASHSVTNASFNTLCGSSANEAAVVGTRKRASQRPLDALSRFLAHYNSKVFCCPYLTRPFGHLSFATHFLFKNPADLRKDASHFSPACIPSLALLPLALSERQQGPHSPSCETTPLEGIFGAWIISQHIRNGYITSLQNRRNSQATHRASVAGGLGIASPTIARSMAATVLSTWRRRAGVRGMASAFRCAIW